MSKFNTTHEYKQQPHSSEVMHDPQCVTRQCVAKLTKAHSSKSKHLQIHYKYIKPQTTQCNE